MGFFFVGEQQKIIGLLFFSLILFGILKKRLNLWFAGGVTQFGNQYIY